MEKLPHIYTVSLNQEDRLIRTRSEQAPELLGGAPPQFGGSPENWSPETLLLASIGQCLFLTFVAICRAQNLDFWDYQSQVDGKLEKTKEGLKFTGATIKVSLNSSDQEKAKILLKKAEKNCLVTNSLSFPVNLEEQIP